MPRYFASCLALALLASACGGAEFGASSSASGGGSGTGGILGTGGSGGRDAATGSGGATGTGGSGTGGGQSAEASTGCSSPTTWYPDQDHDTYGAKDGAVTACDPPPSGAWVTNADDCFDQNELVFPGSPNYFEVGYPIGNGSVSFDYDCNGQEEPAPNQELPAPDCTILTLCTGSGFVPTGRTGSGVNSLCGSYTLSKCTAVGLQCTAVLSTLPSGQGYQCH